MGRTQGPKKGASLQLLGESSKGSCVSMKRKLITGGELPSFGVSGISGKNTSTQSNWGTTRGEILLGLNKENLL